MNDPVNMWVFMLALAGTAILTGGTVPSAADKMADGSGATFHPPKQYDIPLGHPDFYPSSGRPTGWRGDGTGAWPGATCVGTWNAETGENIVWKTNTPGAGFSQPVVVGEKVMVTCDPNLLVCYNVHDGTELWRTAIDHMSVMDPELREKARAETVYFREKRLEFADWSDDCEALAKRVAATGVSVQAGGVGEKPFWSTSPHTHKLSKPDPTDDRSAALADPEIKAEWERLYAIQEENGWWTHHSNNGKLLGHETTLYRRWQQSNRLYDIWFLGAWEGYSTWSFPTPVTDGQHIYVTTVNNAVAAVRVADGTIAWLVWDHLGDAKGERRTADQIGTRYHASPLLRGDRLIVHQDSHMRVYDKRTGEKLWEHVDMYGARKDQFLKRGSKVEAYSALTAELRKLDWDQVLTEFAKSGKRLHGSRPCPEGASPCIVEVPLLTSAKSAAADEDGPSSGVMPVVYDGACFLYRLDDGKVLDADVPFSSASTPLAVGNVLMQSSESTYMVRITAKDRDTLVMDYVFKNLPSDPDRKTEFSANGAYTSIYHDGWWYASMWAKTPAECRNAGVRMALTDGRLETFPLTRGGGYTSPIMVGRKIVFFGDLRAYGSTMDIRGTLDGVGEANVCDLDAGRVISIKPALIDRRLGEDGDYARRNRWVGTANLGGHASPSAQANRIFQRTKGELYCIGDPKQPFPVPANCPPQGRIEG